jgi:hypothetical protein
MSLAEMPPKPGSMVTGRRAKLTPSWNLSHRNNNERQ